ncbi:MAG: hypothetical protein ACXWIQ_11740 [Caldimonas sp.]
MKHRLSFVAAVTLSAVFSALFSVAHPVQAATCAAIDLQNVRPEAGTQDLGGWLPLDCGGNFSAA